ncbi:AraC family transcriptional regulator [uncultured Bacteroides sp.]|uniref:AraC family transcriptional regulator n=1 Tax=uncultured Bacteroides sp. TaxID=162156 RepID=UPI002AAB8A5D|nr:AraC family transcriptional regulator [uncultured Bacteroides sp.]
MIKIKEGFKGQRLLSLSENILAQYAQHPLIAPLYIRKIGYFPKVKFHYVLKEKGTKYYMLIYCIGGKGWYSVYGHRYEVNANQYLIIPSGVSYSFEADEQNPWTIYWLHFMGSMASYLMPPTYGPISILPGKSSRLQDRIELFEEIFSNFSMAYTKEYMIRTSMCLYSFLSSFLHVEQYRYFKTVGSGEQSFSTQVIHFMQENIATKLTLEELAHNFNYSVSHFSALFEKETGVSPIKYFIHLKIRKACEYAELSNLKFREIAEKVGFEEPAYFSRIFTKIMGMSPLQYRLRERISLSISEDNTSK